MTPGQPFEDALAKIAAIGHKEIEPAGGYNNMDPGRMGATKLADISTFEVLNR